MLPEDCPNIQTHTPDFLVLLVTINIDLIVSCTFPNFLFSMIKESKKFGNYFFCLLKIVLSEVLSCVLRQDVLLSQCLSFTQVYKWVPAI